MASLSFACNSHFSNFTRAAPTAIHLPSKLSIGHALIEGQDSRLIASRTIRKWPKGQSIQMLAKNYTSKNASRGKSGGDMKEEVIMVEPSEAKRLAAKQWQEIQAKEKLKRRRRAETVNGAWAMIGLTAGFIVEGRTGNSFATQLAGYWNAFISFFT